MTNTYAHKWTLEDLPEPADDMPTVFSTFSCGGGSTMGYKLAGFNVIGANDIDPEMREHYETNLHPKHYIEAPIKDLTTLDLPEELFNLDILDGSPPCSTFSMAGLREEGWGKEKHFREGQAVQVLDDLFFDFLRVADRLQPKIIVAENVKGMLLGQAKGYLRLIFSTLRTIGYTPQIFLINAADCGVPQKRERVFIIARRDDLNLPPLKMVLPGTPWVTAGEAIADLPPSEKNPHTIGSKGYTLWYATKPGESFEYAAAKHNGKGAWYSWKRLAANQPSNTLTANGGLYHWEEPRRLDKSEVMRLSSFPDDYWTKTEQFATYLCGMSVPPLMMKTVAENIKKQWFTG